MDKHSSTQNTETLLLFEVTLKLDKFCGTEDGQKGTILLFCLDESMWKMTAVVKFSMGQQPNTAAPCYKTKWKVGSMLRKICGRSQIPNR